MKNLFRILATAFVLLILSNKTYAQQAIRVAQFNTDKGVAIQGYDPVTYFTQNKAVKGVAPYQ